jgi:transposase
VKTAKARLDWREGRRRRAWELKEAGWKQTEIAAALGVTSGAVSQWLTRARAEGVEEGLRSHPASGRPPKLTAEQRAQLPALLDRGAEAYGFRGQVWTCKRVGEVIRRTFGVTYNPSHVGRLLHRLGYSVQRPIERATQRDEAAVRGWWERRWPALKKKPTTRTGALSG